MAPSKSAAIVAALGIMVVMSVYMVSQHMDIKDMKKGKFGDMLKNAILPQSAQNVEGGKALAGTFVLTHQTEGFQHVSLAAAQKLFASFCTTMTAKCKNITRFGNKGDGGYEVCLDSDYRPNPKNCIVYSFGIANNWNFDDASRKYGCEVHSFDPSIHKEDHERASHHLFHNTGLWDEDIVNKAGWKLRTLGTIMNDLGHSEKVIDVIKVDIEGAEWPFLRQFIHTNWPRQVRQLIFEIHTPVFKDKSMTVDLYMAIFNDLSSLVHDHGYRLYRVLHNNGCCGRFATLTPARMVIPYALCCYELYFVNTNFKQV